MLRETEVGANDCCERHIIESGLRMVWQVNLDEGGRIGEPTACDSTREHTFAHVNIQFSLFTYSFLTQGFSV